MGRWKCRRRQGALEFTRERDELLRILVNPCILRGGQNKDERKKKILCTHLWEWRHALSNIRRAVGMKIEVEDSKRCNIVAVRKRLELKQQDLE